MTQTSLIIPSELLHEIHSTIMGALEEGLDAEDAAQHAKDCFCNQVVPELYDEVMAEITRYSNQYA